MYTKPQTRKYVYLLLFVIMVAAVTAVTPTHKAIAQNGGLNINNPSQYWNSPTSGLPNYVTHHTFTSQYLKAPYNIVGLNVYTPPDYDLPQNQGKLYPVIYFLHGLNGDENNYFSYFPNLNSGLMGMIEGTASTNNLPVPNAIVVLVNGGAQSFYNDFKDQFHGPNSDFPIQSESIIINEVIPYVDANYRTIANGNGRAIEGFSMGGRGALKLAFNHPEMFCSVVAYAGAGYEEVPINNYYKGPHPVEDRMSTILATNHSAILQNNLQIRLVVGSQDNAQKAPNQTLHEQLNACGVSHQYEPSLPGVKHDYAQYYQASGAVGANFHYQCFQSTGVLDAPAEQTFATINATSGAANFFVYLPAILNTPNTPNPQSGSCN